jgi:hypothetical protein
MSRHKIVKNLDLDDELDDFDGGDDYGYDGYGYGAAEGTASGGLEAAPSGAFLQEIIQSSVTDQDPNRSRYDGR